MNNEISNLFQLEYNLKNCENEVELYYQIVNQTRKFVDYQEAILFTTDFNYKLKSVAISDLVVVDETSLHIQFLNQLSNHLYKKFGDELRVVDIKNDLDDDLRKDLFEYSFPNILWIPLTTIKNNIEIKFYLVLFKVDVFTQKDIDILEHISTSYKYSLFANRKCSVSNLLKKMNFKNKYTKYILLFMFLIMFIPIKMSVLAPFEIEAKEPLIISSPIEGAIEEIKIKPNEFVKKEQLLVKIKDTDLKNNYEIAQKRVDSILAELHTMQQAGFYDIDKKSQIKKLETEVELKQSELTFAKEQLEKTEIFAKQEGIAIINNPNEWQGKPVITGERIFLIAQKDKIEIKIMLAVKDALFLKENSDVKIFIDNKLFETWDAKVSHISYQPELTPENILSYKIIADFNDLKQNEEIPKIGLRGTAKIYSDDVSLFFYLFRKPITTLRQWLAW